MSPQPIIGRSIWPEIVAPRRTDRLFVEPEIHQIVILHHVRLLFQTQLPRPLRLRLATGLQKVREADDFSPNKSFLNVCMNAPGSFPRRHAFANWPCAIFLSANRQEANVTCLPECAEHQRLGLLLFFFRSYGNWLVGEKTVRGYRLKFLRLQSRIKDELLAFQQRLHLFEYDTLAVLWRSSQSCFNKLEVLQDQVRLCCGRC